ncbi:hypothetical protein KR222_000341, partial [Zaprionus bogoriensis]
SPRYGIPVYSDRAVKLLEPLLNKVTGQSDLSKLLLLVAPSSEPNLGRKLHCFENETRKHLGTTVITLNELKLIKEYQMLLKYDIVYTERNVSIKTLARDSNVVEQIVKRCKEENIQREAEPVIKALRQPQISVRLRAIDMKRHNLGKSDSEPFWRH